MRNQSKFNLAKIILGVVFAVVTVLILTKAPMVFAQNKNTNTANSNTKPPVNANANTNTKPKSAPVDTDTTTNGDDGGFVPCGNTADNPCQIGHLFSAFVVIVNYLIGMAGFVAVLAIVFAGFMMITSEGQENLKAAKGRFSGAVIGLVIVALAFVLINALFAGSLSVGVENGANILANPIEYIQEGTN